MRTLISLLIVVLLGAACADEAQDAGTPAADANLADLLIASDSDATTTPEVSDSASGCESLELPSPTLSAETTKFALSLFHFNVEYVVGGLEYEDDEGTIHSMSDVLSDPELVAGWDNDRVEDWIVTETFEPILDLYLAHPTWRVNIELQAYMIEVLAQRHASVLAKLHELAWNGQVELISFHYSAQLFLAFPREDLIRSIARTREVFETHCLPLSGVVFNQEGQAGLGWMRTLVEQGYSIGVYPKNLYLYVHESVPMWPYYDAEGGTMIIGPGSYDPEAGVEIVWDFFDDGELRAVTELINPYLAPLGGKDPARIAEFEAALAAREQDGYLMTTISDMVAHLELSGVERRPAPALVDGTWQAKSTDSIHRWMGGRSDVFAGAEEDNAVRSGNARARAQISTNQILVDHVSALGMDTGAVDAELRSLWDLLFHAEISDASGVNPWRGEVLFALEANRELLQRSETLQTELLSWLDIEHASVDLEARTVTPLDAIPQAGPLLPADPPLEVELISPGRDGELLWYHLGAQAWRLEVHIPAAQECDDCDLKWVELRFARTHDALEYSPGLIEDEVVLQPLDGFDLQRQEVYLPLANGLIGLGDDRYVIKHVRRMHIAARVSAQSTTVDFIDETLPPDHSAVWVFDVIDGSPQEALHHAHRLNIVPVLTLSRQP